MIMQEEFDLLRVLCSNIEARKTVDDFIEMTIERFSDVENYEQNVLFSTICANKLEVVAHQVNLEHKISKEINYETI